MASRIKLSDKELLIELSARFEQNNKMLKQLEDLNEKLTDSEKMKSHFLSNIKNEINNPLSSILGLSQGILNKKDDTELITNSSNLIYEEAFGLNFQIKNIFCAAEIEAGQSSPEVSNVDIAQLIESICDSYQFLANKKNIKQTLEIQTDLHFKSDVQKLSVILSNLLSNAIKFSHEEGEVKISVIIDGHRNLILKIQDFGIGVEKEKTKFIFDRFKQLEDGTTRSFLGHGLGLSIVSSLVDILGGEIDPDCELGEGCKFIISIPEGVINIDEFSDSDNSFLFFDDNSSDEVF